MAFPELNPKASVDELERSVLEYWQTHQIFEKSISHRSAEDEYVFYDGPPFATGLPHYGHILAGTMKDTVPRFWTMKGRRVLRRFGWDCHGLPVENLIEKELKLESKEDIEKFGIEKFNEACAASVMKYAQEWRKVVERTGRWVDMDHDYKTMDRSYMESVWWIFKRIWDKGLVYEGQKAVPYCFRCSTPLSNFEANQGYRDRQDQAVTIKFAVRGQPNTFFLAWTTTPWTLPSNLALAVGADIDYVRIEDRNGEQYIMAQNRLAAYYKNPADYTVVAHLKGDELENWEYEPLFPYFTDLAATGAFKVVTADFVSTEDGTGIVHIAPGFGEDDHLLGQAKGLPFVCPVDEMGRHLPIITDFAGLNVLDSNKPIMEHLKKTRQLVHVSTINHSYPYCWRCETPLIYKAIPTWYIAVTKIKDQMIAANQDIHWVPENIKDGRFGKWLEGARDWAISRNRYWGATLPIWRCSECAETVAFGSIAELAAASGQTVDDLHKQVVDKITYPCACGGTMKRIPEVFDCWFESGSMPYAQKHYPFENKTEFEATFPAEFIAEGQDQTRGWFYTLLVVSTALFGKAPFRNVIVNGTILNEAGEKMSKSKRNYPDPMELIKEFGADAMRFYMLNSPVVEAQDLDFSAAGVAETFKTLTLPTLNAYNFFATYANIDQWEAKAQLPSFTNPLDTWIISELEVLKEKVNEEMHRYSLYGACRPIPLFIDSLTNWYIRRSRRRFWKSENDTDKEQAYACLHYVLKEYAKVLAPFAPFLAEWLYRNLTGAESVHLEQWSEPIPENLQPALNTEIATVRTIVRLGLAARAKKKIKVRQPLALMELIVPDQFADMLPQYIEVLQEELNVKEVKLSQGGEIAKKVARPNARVLGPRFKGDVQRIINAAKRGDFEESEHWIIVWDGSDRWSLTKEEAAVGYEAQAGFDVEADAGVVVLLDTNLTPALIDEGWAREIVRAIQDLRRTAGYQVADRITIAITGAEEVVKNFGSYIQKEVLADAIVADLAADQTATLDLDGKKVTVAVKK